MGRAPGASGNRGARAGVDVVQLRERGLEDRRCWRWRGRSTRHRRHARRLVVNERIDVALAAGADGVHLPGCRGAREARTIVADGFLVGRSVHSVAEAIAAEDSGGCDYLVFGTVFESESKPAGHRVGGL